MARSPEDYWEKYCQSGAAEVGSGERKFFRFLETLNEREWQHLLEDLLYQRPRALNVVRPPVGSHPLAHATQLFERLAPPVCRLLRRSAERLLQEVESEAISDNGVGQDDSDHHGEGLLLDRLLTFCALIPGSLAPSILMKLAQSDNIAPNSRFHAAAALANQDDQGPSVFWEGISLHEFPELAPAVVTVLTDRSPEKALTRLTLLEHHDEYLDRLEYPLRVLLRRLAQNVNGAEVIGRVLASGPSWLKTTLGAVLEFPEFSEFYSLVRLTEEGSSVRLARVINGVEDYLSRGNCSLGSLIEPADLFRDALEEVIKSWEPSTRRSLDYSVRLINAVDTPSRICLEKVLKFLELAVNEYSSETLKGDPLNLAIEAALRLLGTASLALLGLYGTSSAGEDFRERYWAIMFKLIGIPRFGLTSLRQVLGRVLDRKQLNETVRSALSQDHLSVESIESCLDVSLGEEVGAMLLGEVILREPLDDVDDISNTELEIGKKLYEYNPLFVAGDDVKSLIIADQSVATSFAGWVQSTVPGN